MARPLTPAEQHLIRAMIMYAKATQPEHSAAPTNWQQWRRDRLALMDRLSAGEPCDCGNCPSVQLLVDGAPVAPGADPIILEAFVSEGLVMLFIDDGYPSYLEIAPNPDVQLELPSEDALIF